jgi:hypothetical protein
MSGPVNRSRTAVPPAGRDYFDTYGAEVSGRDEARF